jgi:hypothetical protein
LKKKSKAQLKDVKKQKVTSNYLKCLFLISSDVADLLTLLLTKSDAKTIIDEELTFLFAGYDTTSKLMVTTT